MSKMITTSNTNVQKPLRDGVEKKVLKDGTVVLVSTKPLTTISSSKVRPRTKLEGEETKNYYPPLTTSLLNQFPRTKKGKSDRDKFMEAEADKKRLAEVVPPVLSKEGTQEKE